MHIPITQPVPLDATLPRLTYRPAEAARLLGIGRSTLYLYVQKGVLRTIRLGGCTLIRAEDLRALITSNGEGR